MTGPVVYGRLGVAVLEVERVHHQGLGQLVPVRHPDTHTDLRRALWGGLSSFYCPESTGVYVSNKRVK